jgi:hypothetical protein
MGVWRGYLSFTRSLHNGIRESRSGDGDWRSFNRLFGPKNPKTSLELKLKKLRGAEGD